MASRTTASRQPAGACDREPRVALSFTRANSAATKKPFRTMKRAARASPSTHATYFSNLLDASFSEKTRGFHQQDADKNHENEYVLAAGIVAQLHQLADEADEPPPQPRPRDAADAPQDGGHEGPRADDHPHGGVHLRLVEAVQDRA